MNDALEQDQVDLYGRLLAAPALAEVKVLFQRKGVTDNDVLTALSVFNEGDTGKLGCCCIVLMPALTLSSRNDGGKPYSEAPGPRYFIDLVVQVIEMPLISLGDGGVGLSAEQVAQFVRTIGHHFANGFGGTYTFAGMEPIPVSDGQVSYGVHFTRMAGDAHQPKVAAPSITSDSGGSAPGNVTITCATLGAAIWFTTDGSYPSGKNPAALEYSGPFVQATAATIRAAAEAADFQQSDIRQLTLS